MFSGGRRSYALAVILTLLLHAGLMFLLVTYHDKLATLQLIDPKPLQLTLVNTDFEPIQITPVQSRLIIEQKPKPQKKPEPKATKKKTASKSPQEKEKKTQASTQPKKTNVKDPQSTQPKKKPKPTTKKTPEPDPVDKKVNKTKKAQDTDSQTKEPSNQSTTEQLPDTPEARVAKRFVGRIQKRIEKNWSKPLNVQYDELAGLKVLIRLVLTPKGRLERADIIQSSGNNQFDRSALNAVLRTDQFPVPADAAVFQKYFRQLTISYNL